MLYLLYLCLFSDSDVHTYCVGFLFVCLCIVSSAPYLASFTRLSIFNCPFGIL